MVQVQPSAGRYDACGVAPRDHFSAGRAISEALEFGTSPRSRPGQVDLLPLRPQPLCGRLDRPAPQDRAVATALIDKAGLQQQIRRDQLTAQADRGSSLTSNPVAFLLAELAATPT